MSKEKRNKPTFEDDGRTIANMNVEGMPWYKASSRGSDTDAEGTSGSKEQPEQLSKEGQRAMTGGIMAASLLIGGIYTVVILLFILFCIFVWFK